MARLSATQTQAQSHASFTFDVVEAGRVGRVGRASGVGSIVSIVVVVVVAVVIVVIGVSVDVVEGAIVVVVVAIAVDGGGGGVVSENSVQCGVDCVDLHWLGLRGWDGVDGGLILIEYVVKDSRIHDRVLEVRRTC